MLRRLDSASQAAECAPTVISLLFMHDSAASLCLAVTELLLAWVSCRQPPSSVPWAPPLSASHAWWLGHQLQPAKWHSTARASVPATQAPRTPTGPRAL